MISSEKGDDDAGKPEKWSRLLSLAEPREVARYKRMLKQNEKHTYDPEIQKLVN
jgi:hypothetical protein